MDIMICSESITYVWGASLIYIDEPKQFYKSHVCVEERASLIPEICWMRAACHSSDICETIGV